MTATTDSARLCLHHVGGRDGTRAFPLLPRFEGDFVNVIYEADVDCLDQIADRNTPLASGFRLMPHCLGGSSGPGTLRVCHDQFTCSLYAPNPDYAGHYGFFGDQDYVLGDSMRVCEERTVAVDTLDELCAPGAAAVPNPDFLSIDTQGSEYDILSGGRRVVSGNVLAVYCEVEFVPLYRGQKLFGDVAALLAECGLNFAAFTRIDALSPRREALGLRGRGFDAYGEALFLRHPGQVADDDPVRAYCRHLKAAFIAVLYDQFEFALAHLRPAMALPPTAALDSATAGMGYVRFMRDLWDAVSLMPQVFPPGFRDHYPAPADSAKRFCKGADRGGSAFSMDAWARTVAPEVRSMLLDARFTPVEEVLAANDFTGQAETLRRTRLGQARSLFGERAAD